MEEAVRQELLDFKKIPDARLAPEHEPVPDVGALVTPHTKQLLAQRLQQRRQQLARRVNSYRIALDEEAIQAMKLMDAEVGTAFPESKAIPLSKIDPALLR
jgi:hypothetical protein